MRRAPIVFTSTVAGLAAVLSFKARTPTLPVATVATAPPAAAASPTPTPTPTGARSSSARSSARTRTATGDVVPTQYGNAQVRVTLTGGKITSIEALQLPSDEPKSVMISSAAEPLLRQSALTKQSAAIDMVSGATFTSASYESSLQSALDKLGYKAPDGSRGTATVPNGDGGPGGGPPGGGFR